MFKEIKLTLRWNPMENDGVSWALRAACERLSLWYITGSWTFLGRLSLCSNPRAAAYWGSVPNPSGSHSTQRISKKLSVTLRQWRCSHEIVMLCRFMNLQWLSSTGQRHTKQTRSRGLSRRKAEGKSMHLRRCQTQQQRKVQHKQTFPFFLQHSFLSFPASFCVLFMLGRTQQQGSMLTFPFRSAFAPDIHIFMLRLMF